MFTRVLRLQALLIFGFNAGKKCQRALKPRSRRLAHRHTCNPAHGASTFCEQSYSSASRLDMSVSPGSKNSSSNRCQTISRDQALLPKMEKTEVDFMSTPAGQPSLNFSSKDCAVRRCTPLPSSRAADARPLPISCRAH